VVTPAHWRTIGAALLLTFANAATAAAHPMHNTITEITEDRVHGTVRAVIRVFADDFDRVLSRNRSSSALAYLSRAFVFTGGDGRGLSLRSCGTKATSGVLWICVETDSRDGLAALQLRATMLCDLYDDQVNVVQATTAGVRRTFLFTRGAGGRKIG
jgi:hypothetical protein